MTDERNVQRPIAAIDVGTNSFHMVIATVSARGVLEIHARDKETVRLGSGAGDMKRLAVDAMDRGVAAMRRFAKLADQHNAVVRAIATSAVREALNKDEFVERVQREAGIAIEVVPGTEEARLIYVGAIHALPIVNQRCCVIDIGGGSTETIIGYQGEAEVVHSAKLGHLRYTKRFFPDGIVTPARIEECRIAVRGEWASMFQTMRTQGFDTFVGCSGTIMAIAAITHLRIHARMPETLNGMTYALRDIQETIDTILATPTIDARQSIPGMESKRGDVIVAGAIILEQAMRGLGADELTISSYALREGIVFDTVQKDDDIRRFHHLAHLRYQSVDHVCDLYHVRRPHAVHVKNLAIRLFDGLRLLHGYGDRELELLEAAALLHDVGYHIGADQHHKHSEYIIRNSAMPGFTNDETEIIATIARYHRKSHPKKKHASFMALTIDEQQVVRVLASILRVAEGLDRRQQQLVQRVRVQVSSNGVDVYLVVPSGLADIELWGAERRKELLEETFQRPVRFVLDAH